MNNERDKIELLDISLLDDKEFSTIQYWLDVFRAEVGWHYYLDLIWQLKEIKKLQLPSKATIIDAGAGTGMMQFILASLGYNVISIDFNQRRPSKLYSKIFDIKYDYEKVFNDEYITHLKAIESVAKNKSYLSKIIKTLNYRLVFEFFRPKRKSYGSIKFVTADFSNIDFIRDNSVDAIVSTSAIEHNENIEKLSLSIGEFKRVLKKDASMFITTSATKEKTWWLEPSKGYCFSESDLKEIFDLFDYNSNFDHYDKIFSNIKNSSFLRKKLPSLYFNNPNCGMPYGIWDPKYIPVGIIKSKY